MPGPQNKQLNVTTPGAELNIIFHVQAHGYKFSSNWFDRFTLVKLHVTQNTEYSEQRLVEMKKCKPIKKRNYLQYTEYWKD